MKQSVKVATPFPGLTVAIGDRVFDLSTDRPFEVARVEGTSLAQAPVATRHGLLVLTSEGRLDLVGSPRSDTRTVATNVGAAAASDDGARVAWSERSNGLATVLVEATLGRNRA